MNLPAMSGIRPFAEIFAALRGFPGEIVQFDDDFDGLAEEKSIDSLEDVRKFTSQATIGETVKELVRDFSVEEPIPGVSMPTNNRFCGKY